MKILLINNFFYRKGGSEAVFFNTADILREAGHEVMFFSFEDKKNIHINDSEYFIKRGGALCKIRDYFSNPLAAKKLDEVLTREKPDIAHAHLFWGGISPSIFAVLRKHSIPLVHTAHDYRMVCPAYLLTDGMGMFCERCKDGKFYQCAIHRCSKGSSAESLLMSIEMYYRNWINHPAKALDGIIFVSNFSRNKHFSFDKRLENVRTMVLYNFPGSQVKESLDMDKDTYDSYYLFYGRLSKEKGVFTLLKAFEKFPQLMLKIVGTGPLEEELKAYCFEHHLENVEFVGYKTGKELFDLVAGAKYVCVSSECYENNPMTIVEAYSLRTPVIGASIGGISEVVNDAKTGYIFESANVESLAYVLSLAHNLRKEDYNCQKEFAYQFANQHFNKDLYVERLVSFYKEIIGNYAKTY